MSGSGLPPDILAAIGGIERTIDSGAASADQLRTILTLLDDVTLVPEIKALLARMNNQPQVYEVPNTLTRTMRRAEELRDEREFRRSLATTMGAGGGTALLVGSLLACLNPVVGAIALIPAAGGAWVGFVAWAGGRRLDKERTLYRQIAERLAAVLKGVE